jgi:F-type H+-transporting ATPase subunit delta
MTQVGAIYGQALYDLARSEQLDCAILQELAVLDESFSAEPDYLKLLCAPQLSKQERCRIVDESFVGKVHPYVLNFLKLLTEKGYMRHFHSCFETFEELYNQDNGIVPVTVTTAVVLSQEQEDRLQQKLSAITGKTVRLKCRIDPAVLGGVQLDMGNIRMEDTVAQRLENLRKLLQQTTI